MKHYLQIYVNGHRTYKCVISDSKNINEKGQRCPVAECLYTNETNLVLAKQGC